VDCAVTRTGRQEQSEQPQLLLLRYGEEDLLIAVCVLASNGVAGAADVKKFTRPRVRATLLSDPFEKRGVDISQRLEVIASSSDVFDSA